MIKSTIVDVTINTIELLQAAQRLGEIYGTVKYKDLRFKNTKSSRNKEIVPNEIFGYQ